MVSGGGQLVALVPGSVLVVRAEVDVVDFKVVLDMSTDGLIQERDRRISIRVG